MRTTNLYSDGLSCPSCVGKIEGRLRQLPGVERSTVHVTTGRIEVHHDEQVADVPALVGAIAEAGYQAAPRGF
jgi:copper chaperone